MLNKKTIEDIDVDGKRVLVRCDFNVPFDSDTGDISDDRRIVEALPTIKYLINNNAKVILCSHLGRPKGEFNMKYTLAPVAKRLSKLLDKEVIFSKDVIGEDTKNKVDNLKNKDVLLLENVRFHKEEEENDDEFSKKLASFADVYVNDAFGTSHRAHSSTAGVAKYLPAVSGYLIQKEIDMLGSVLNDPDRPFVAILGGSKVSDKIGVIKNLLDKVDTLIIGGGMAYTFLKAQDYEVGDSILEPDFLDMARDILDEANDKGIEILLPIDTVIAKEISNEAESTVVLSSEMPAGFKGVDIGPKTLEMYESVLREAKTVVWNGPVGVFEIEKFANGTNEIARLLAEIDGATIIGGGDSASAVEKAGVADKMTHISTGGGASLEFLEGKDLPGIACLMDK